MDFPDAAQKWDARFANSEGPLFGEQPNAWLRDQAHWLQASATVCCLADGEGRNSVWLAQRGHRVSAFDLSSVAISRSRHNAQKHNVQTDLRVASLAQWIGESCDADAHETLDAIVAIFIQFAGPALRRSLFDAVHRLLKPGGIFIVEGYGLRQLKFRTGGPGAIENLYSLTLMPMAFSGWFTLASRDTEIALSEGSAHAGQSHVISAVLRKPAAPI